MPSSTSRADVRRFLLDFKRAATSATSKKAQVWSRAKNRDAPLDLGLSERQRDDVLLALQPEDYVAGPLPDDDPAWGGDVWVFGACVHGEDVYIKLKLAGVEPLQHAVCISFHKAERELSFPFRNATHQGDAPS